MKRPDRLTLILTACALAVVCLLAPLDRAHATTNLALECFSTQPASAVPKSCPQGWTWHTPGAGAVVTTSGGAWKIFSNPPSADIIELCKANLSPGAAATACTAANIVYLPGCNAATFTCSSTPVTPPVTPTPPDTQAVVHWTRPTQNTDDSPLTTLNGYVLYRGTKLDSSDLAKYKTFLVGDLPIDEIGPFYTDVGLTAGQWCYGVEAYTSETPPVYSGMSTNQAVGSNCKTIVIPPPVLTPVAPVLTSVK